MASEATVQLAAVLVSPVAALAGVGLGPIITARTEARKWRRERRAQAYEQALSGIETMRAALWSNQKWPLSQQQLGEFVTPMSTTYSLTVLYGTKEAAKAFRDLLDLAIQYGSQAAVPDLTEWREKSEHLATLLAGISVFLKLAPSDHNWFRRTAVPSGCRAICNGLPTGQRSPRTGVTCGQLGAVATRDEPSSSSPAVRPDGASSQSAARSPSPERAVHVRARLTLSDLAFASRPGRRLARSIRAGAVAAWRTVPEPATAPLAVPRGPSWSPRRIRSASPAVGFHRRWDATSHLERRKVRR
jgi:type II secretory pathway pseudopilin PulG